MGLIDALTRRLAALGLAKDSIDERDLADVYRAAVAEVEPPAGGIDGGGAPPPPAVDLDRGAVRLTAWYRDRQAAVQQALAERYGALDVIDINDEECVYVTGGWRAQMAGGGEPPAERYWRQPYTYTEGSPVELGEAQQVTPRTDYVPLQLENGDESLIGCASRPIRLAADGSSDIPQWQQLHEIGDWVRAHPSGHRIQFDAAWGDSFIENWRAGVPRRVPMDEVHTTGKRGPALAWMTDIRWGANPTDGLPGHPEPDGETKNYLFGKWDYTPLGLERITNREFAYGSLEYVPDYVNPKTGQSYGPTVLAFAATNDPFIPTMRTLQGELSPAVQLDAGGVSVEPPATTPITAAPPAQNSVTLEQHEAALNRIAAMEAELRQSRANEHAQRVQLDVSSRVAAGLPPAVANVARTILLACPEDAAGTIQLSADPGAQPVNMYAATLALIDTVGRMPLGRHTQATEIRLDNTSGPAPVDHLAVAREARKAAGLPSRSAAAS